MQKPRGRERDAEVDRRVDGKSSRAERNKDRAISERHGVSERRHGPTAVRQRRGTAKYAVC